MKSEYEYTDREQDLYSQSQNNDNQEPEDKVTKWFVFLIIVGALIVIIVQLKHNIGR